MKATDLLPIRSYGLNTQSEMVHLDHLDILVLPGNGRILYFDQGFIRAMALMREGPMDVTTQVEVVPLHHRTTITWPAGGDLLFFKQRYTRAITFKSN